MSVDWQPYRRKRRIPPEAHVGKPVHFLRRHRADCERRSDMTEADRDKLHDLLLTRIADTRNLRLAWVYLATHGGDATGPNGLTWSDLDSGAVWDLLRTLQIGRAHV